MAAAMLLADTGVPYRRLRVVACADNERAVPPARVSGRHRTNQRVELVVTRDQPSEDPHQRDSPRWFK